jgi:hypothetical protein
MLDLWRSPQGAGDPLGCLATTYTFSPGLFDEQCLARFLEIDSEPNREDLAFLLERESRLGSVYAGVLVDYTQAGVEHSLRWDVLPVRIKAGKQHAKLSLLSWSEHIRIILASANLSEPGYRTNYEVAAAIEIIPEKANAALLTEAIAFLRSLLQFVPGALQPKTPPEVQRAHSFLEQIEQQVQLWKVPPRESVRQHLVFTLPTESNGRPARSSLEEAIAACRRRGGSPKKAKVVSPFFDQDSDTNRVTASLSKFLARGTTRELRLGVPAVHDAWKGRVPRLVAPKALWKTALQYNDTVYVDMLPDFDEDKNRRQWHAKMLALQHSEYVALMIGSSNFTCAGMGVGSHRNAEANLLTIANRGDYKRVASQLEAVWPELETVADPESAEWLGATPDNEEEEQAKASSLPLGFVSAMYRAGENRCIVLRLNPESLPEDWSVHACGNAEQELLSASNWAEGGGLEEVEIAWPAVQPPNKLLVLWEDQEAFLPINIEDSRELPPPALLEQMTADDMLWILAATDPSAAFRVWARRHQPEDATDDLDSATPIDLDPLRRYDLQATFLHRIRRRARILAQLRVNLEQPVWGRQALEWRLRGLIGIAPLADRLTRELEAANEAADEALLALADLLIILRDVDYQSKGGALPKPEFEKIFRPFLDELVGSLRQRVSAHHSQISVDVLQFWEQVVKRCLE